MKNLVIISYLLYFLVTTGCFITKNKTSNEVSEVFIRFGSGYKTDTISLKINNVSIFKNEIISTKEDNSSITTNYLTIRRDSVFNFTNGVLVSTFNLFLNYDDKIIVDPVINNRPYSFTMYFKNGKFLFIDKHHYYYNVYFNQYKNKPELY